MHNIYEFVRRIVDKQVSILGELLDNSETNFMYPEFAHMYKYVYQIPR